MCQALKAFAIGFEYNRSSSRKTLFLSPMNLSKGQVCFPLNLRTDPVRIGAFEHQDEGHSHGVCDHTHIYSASVSPHISSSHKTRHRAERPAGLRNAIPLHGLPAASPAPGTQISSCRGNYWRCYTADNTSDVERVK